MNWIVSTKDGINFNEHMGTSLYNESSLYQVKQRSSSHTCVPHIITYMKDIAHVIQILVLIKELDILPDIKQQIKKVMMDKLVEGCRHDTC